MFECLELNEVKQGVFGKVAKQMLEPKVRQEFKKGFESPVDQMWYPNEQFKFIEPTEEEQDDEQDEDMAQSRIQGPYLWVYIRDFCG